MYAHFGDGDAQELIRKENSDKAHCPWLRRSPTACEALPEGIDGVEPGIICPHHVYYHKSEVFANRERVADTIDRLFRLLGEAEAGLLVESDLDPTLLTELLVARGELNRQQNERQREETERIRLESETNRQQQLLGMR